MDDHSILPPSGAVRWAGGCPASARLEYNMPKRPAGPAAIEGRRLHAIAADILNNDEGISTDEAVQGYVDAVREQTDPLHMDKFLEVEGKIQIPRIHEVMFGTPDVWFYDAIGKVIYVFDLKTGKTPVYSEGNLSLLCYASGALTKVLQRHNIGIEEITFRLQICQFHIHKSDAWTISGKEFLEREQKLFKAAHNAMSDNPEMMAGDHCTWCLNRLTCGELSKANGRAVALAGKGDVEGATDEELADELRLIQKAFGILKARESALKTELFEKLKAGAQINSCAFKTKLGNRTWVTPDKVTELATLFPQLRKTVLLSPAQAEKSGVPKELVATLTHRLEKIELDLFPTDKSKQIFGGNE